MVPIATQTDTQRQVAGKKAASTRLQNEAKRSRDATQATLKRARARVSRLQGLGLQARRAADATVGTAAQAGESVADTVRPFRDQRQARQEASRVQERVTTEFRKAERRGARIRQRTQRELTRRRKRLVEAAQRTRRNAEGRLGSDNRGPTARTPA